MEVPEELPVLAVGPPLVATESAEVIPSIVVLGAMELASTLGVKIIVSVAVTFG